MSAKTCNKNSTSLLGSYLLEEVADGIGRDDRRYGPIPALRVRMRE